LLPHACYNDVQFISECIESILEQDYPHIEHVIQDGGSADGTVELISDYIDRFPDKIKYISESDNRETSGSNKPIHTIYVSELNIL